MPHVAMGIDQSLTCTGWCIRKNGTEYYGSVRTKNDKSMHKIKDHIKRAYHIADELLAKAQEHNVKFALLESISIGSVGRATTSLPLLMGIILATFRDNGIQCEILEPTALKKYATGKGNADKEKMLAAIGVMDPNLKAVLDNMPKAQGRYDIADAYWLATYLEEYLNESIN